MAKPIDQKPTPKGTAAAKKAWDTIRSKRAAAQSDDLPPHAIEAEMGALSCVLQAGDMGSQQNVDVMLQQLRPAMLYDHRCKTLLIELTRMRMENKAIDMAMVILWLKGQPKSEGSLLSRMEECGGQAWLQTKLLPAAPSVLNFNYYLPELENFQLRRFLLRLGPEAKDLAAQSDLTAEKATALLSDFLDKGKRITPDTTPLIRVVSPAQARAYEANPADFLVGDGLIAQGMFIGMVGAPGVGKSRLATTLAVAGARGTNRWQNIPVRCKFRTLILQQENSSIRLKKEFEAVPAKFNDDIRVSDGLRDGLAFYSADFRREVRRIYDEWPFQMMVIDPWNRVTADDDQRAYMDALSNIEACFRGCPKMPAVVIVAHMRKRSRDDKNMGPKKGRELLDEIAGSLGLGSSCRTVFSVQPVTSDLSDYRIIFDIAKNNDDDTLDHTQTRSAWMRANGAFEALPEFDWAEFDNPGDPDRRKLTEDDLRTALAGETKHIKPAVAARKIKALTGSGESTVLRAISPKGYMAHLFDRDALGMLLLKTNGHPSPALPRA